MLPSVELVAAVKSVLENQLSAHSYFSNDDEFVRLLAGQLYAHGNFTTHGRGLQLLPTEDVKAAVLIAQACDPVLYELLVLKAGPQFTLKFAATSRTTYDMIVLVYSKLIAERRIGRGTQERFVERMATHLAVPRNNQSLFNQVVDSLELLKQLGEEVPHYLLEEAVMV